MDQPKPLTAEQIPGAQLIMARLLSAVVSRMGMGGVILITQQEVNDAARFKTDVSKVGDLYRVVVTAPKENQQ
jgi:hypothetical protein